MRAIDADALIKIIKADTCNPCKEYYADRDGHRCPFCIAGDCLKAIEQQPTIDPERKEGKWDLDKLAIETVQLAEALQKGGVEMCEKMTFPDTVEEFMEQYKITDTEHVYTNGAEMIPIFRMNQWFEHLPSAPPEIIRCKDCEWFDESYPLGTYAYGVFRCSRVKMLWMEKDAFCSYGKRRDSNG